MPPGYWQTDRKLGLYFMFHGLFKLAALKVRDQTIYETTSKQSYGWTNKCYQMCFFLLCSWWLKKSTPCEIVMQFDRSWLVTQSCETVDPPGPSEHKDLKSVMGKFWQLPIPIPIPITVVRFQSRYSWCIPIPHMKLFIDFDSNSNSKIGTVPSLLEIRTWHQFSRTNIFWSSWLHGVPLK